MLEKITSRAQTAQPFNHLQMVCRNYIPPQKRPKPKFYNCQTKGIKRCPRTVSFCSFSPLFSDFCSKQKQKNVRIFAQPLHNSLLSTSELFALSQTVSSFLQKAKQQQKKTSRGFFLQSVCVEVTARATP